MKATLLFAVLLAASNAARAQDVPDGIPVETFPVESLAGAESHMSPALPGAPSSNGWSGIALQSGERVVVWVENRARAHRPDAAPPPVGEARVGEIVARFAESGWFAWPREPTVWTAPRAGELRFALNGYPEHGIEGSAELGLVRIGLSGEGPPAGFAPPMIALERVPGGVEARYRDRAGFGLDLETLRFEITTASGTRFHLGPWVRAQTEATVLPMPPPGVPLPPGIHTLAATITDRLGGSAPPARIVFDAVQ